MVFLSGAGFELNMMAFTMLSLSAGCRHCQAHGAYGLAKAGVPIEKIQGLWNFATSDLFDDRECAALSFAAAASTSPSAVTAEHHAALRSNFSDEEVRSLLAVVSVAGFMNR
ncbi:MAG: alkylhydroperoxidase family enzyme [Candidatus Poriferisodalaceae bacterium]|jgi:alkylhydroperoxidase family enzyme